MLIISVNSKKLGRYGKRKVIYSVMKPGIIK